MSNIGSNIQNIRKKLGFTAADFAEIFGIPCRTYQGYERNERTFPHEIILKIVKKFNANFNYIYTGSANMFNENTQNECCYLPVISSDIDKNAEKFSISYEFIKNTGANPSTCQIAYAKGNSMEPTIFHGDSLLIDTSKKEIYDGILYCIDLDGQIYSKRLQKLSKNIIGIVSDNIKYEMIKTDIALIKIIGEIRWIGRTPR